VAGLLGISDLLEKRPRQLSGGQRQRVALGRAIIRRPRVFLMDEPLSNLDARLRMETRGELKRLHAELRITTIYVTHDQSEAMGLSDRLAVLDRGAVQQCDRPLAVYRRPANRFVAGFIGIPAMNILPARVVRELPLEVEMEGARISVVRDERLAEQNILIGVRPEDVLAERRPGQGSIEMELVSVEPAGPVTWVELLFRKVLIRAMTKPGEDLEVGKRCYARMAPDRISLFSTESGMRI
jgi:multiple sugar transport system ATP-binding protein